MTNVAEKEKVEKRRALGRGLDSLLPGPRVVGGNQTSDLRPQTSDLRPRTSGNVPLPVEQQAPHRPSPVWNDDLNEAAAPYEPAPHEASPPDAAVVRSMPSAHPPAQNAGRVGQPIPETESDEPGWEGPYQDEVDEAADGTISIQAVADTRAPSNLVINLAISDIDRNPFQTRHITENEALEELAKSIKANGVVQPIVVRPAKEEGRYVLILGERRIHASKKAGKTHIPAIVRKVSTQQAAEMTIIENLQRDDLSPLEHAEAFRILSLEFKLSQAQIGQRVGLSRESVANYMRLLKLPEAAIELLRNGSLSFGKAKELLRLDDDVAVAAAATYAVKHGMTIEEIQRLVTNFEIGGDYGHPVRPKSGGARWVDPNVRAAQNELQQILGVKVKISDRKGKGKIVIEYATVEDYERVVGMLRGE
jgi:ParB family transcriptional regulator, chromosome partitioning protein